MIKMTKTVLAVGSSLSLLAVAAMPAFASTTVTVTGTGAFSSNHITVHDSSTTTVKQSNFSVVDNTVNQHANTGGNSSNFNVGGTQSITTGDVAQTTTITNNGNSNSAMLPSCTCSDPTVTVDVTGTGAFSHTDVNVTSTSKTSVTQGNIGVTSNDVTQHGNTGGNSSSFNVGSGGSTMTGGVGQTITITNTGGTNTVL